MDKEAAEYILRFLEWINKNIEVKNEDFEHYSNCMMNSESMLQDFILKHDK